MIQIKAFTFNPFQENTYVVYDENKNALIIDPGNSNSNEDTVLSSFITGNGLRPVRLLLTHGHIDHIMGNRFVFETYGLLPEVHHDDLFFLERMMETAKMYGVNVEPSPLPAKFLLEDDEIKLGTEIFKCIHTPGHSPGSISFYNKSAGLLISGDVLFNGSIGRSDLPMGDHQTLISSITGKLLGLGDEVRVYSGHGPETTIGRERKTNPFLT